MLKRFQHIDAANIVIVIVVGATVMYAVQFCFNRFQIGTDMDDANHIILAESIAQGSGFRQINDPSTPLEMRYPPGYPLVLAPLVNFAWSRIDILKPPSIAATILSIMLGWKLLRTRRVGKFAASLSVALFALNPLVLSIEKVEQVEKDIARKQRTTAYLWMAPYSVEEVGS